MNRRRQHILPRIVWVLGLIATMATDAPPPQSLATSATFEPFHVDGRAARIEVTLTPKLQERATEVTLRATSSRGETLLTRFHPRIEEHHHCELFGLCCDSFGVCKTAFRPDEDVSDWELSDVRVSVVGTSKSKGCLNLREEDLPAGKKNIQLTVRGFNPPPLPPPMPPGTCDAGLGCVVDAGVRPPLLPYPFDGGDVIGEGTFECGNPRDCRFDERCVGVLSPELDAGGSDAGSDIALDAGRDQDGGPNDEGLASSRCARLDVGMADASTSDGGAADAGAHQQAARTVLLCERDGDCSYAVCEAAEPPASWRRCVSR